MYEDWTYDPDAAAMSMTTGLPAASLFGANGYHFADPSQMTTLTGQNRGGSNAWLWQPTETNTAYNPYQFGGQNNYMTGEVARYLRPLGWQIAAVEAEIGKYGVAPNTLRDAIAINDREIASVPPLEAGFRLVADAISADPALRLSELQLRLILPSANTCGVDLTSEDGMKRPEASAPGVAKRRNEIGFDLTIPGSYGPRERAQTVRLVSRRLTDVGGLSLWTDANKELSAGNLRGGTTVNAASRQGWCFTVPGMPAEEAMPAQEKRT